MNIVKLPVDTLPVNYVRNFRARRYILRLSQDGAIRVTVPRWGSKREAHAFVLREQSWIERQMERRILIPHSQPWSDGSTFMFRGELATIRLEPGKLCFASEEIDLKNDNVAVRELVEARLRDLATKELTKRTFELAEDHQVTVKRVAVRSQRTRWGSCSIRGTISLNWRLIQTPPFVLDYIIVHELMHLREMNHSRRFWRNVAAACPDYQAAEKWLRKSRLLIF